jgi:CheY-like chemotaxis protein
MIADLGMPAMDGFELTAQVYRSEDRAKALRLPEVGVALLDGGGPKAYTTFMEQPPIS